MKLVDIYTSTINETLNAPLSYKKVSETRYQVDLNNEEKLFVILNKQKINNFECLTILFVNPNSNNPTAITNFFNGPSAVRIFSTIVAILEPIQFDIIIFTPDDINVEIESKKTNLYKVILKKLERLGKISGSEILNIENFNKPVLVGLKSARGLGLNNNELNEIVRQFGYIKFS